MLLRITRVLKLEGVLVRHLARLLEQECARYRDVSGLMLDLSGVSVVDRSGVEALRRLQGAGVVLWGCSDPVACILEAEGVGVHRSAADR